MVLNSACADVFTLEDRTVGQGVGDTTAVGPPEGRVVIQARFRMALPEDIWVRQVSTSFPDATLRLLTGVPKGDQALELGEVRAENARTVASDIRAHPDIFEFDQVYAGDGRVIAQYEADEKGLYEFLWESSLPPEFPTVSGSVWPRHTAGATSTCPGSAPSRSWPRRWVSTSRQPA